MISQRMITLGLGVTMMFIITAAHKDDEKTPSIGETLEEGAHDPLGGLQKKEKVVVAADHKIAAGMTLMLDTLSRAKKAKEASSSDSSPVEFTGRQQDPRDTMAKFQEETNKYKAQQKAEQKAKQTKEERALRQMMRGKVWKYGLGATGIAAAAAGVFTLGLTTPGLAAKNAIEAGVLDADQAPGLGDSDIMAELGEILTPDNLTIIMYAGIAFYVIMLCSLYIHFAKGNNHNRGGRIAAVVGVMAGTAITSTVGIIDTINVTDDLFQPDMHLTEFVMIGGATIAFVCLMMVLWRPGKKCTLLNGLVVLGGCAGVVGAAGLGACVQMAGPEGLGSLLQADAPLDSFVFLCITCALGGIAGLFFLISFAWNAFGGKCSLKKPAQI